MEVIILYAKQCEMHGAGYDLLTLYPEPRFEYHCGLSNGQHFPVTGSSGEQETCPGSQFRAYRF